MMSASHKIKGARDWLVMLLIVAVVAIALMTAPPASAHRNEVHEMNQQAEQATADQLTVGSDAPMGGMMDMDSDRSQMSFVERLLDWLGRTHPFIVHFPIAFFPAALFTAVVGRRRPGFAAPVQFLVVTGGVLAPVAALFGWINGGWTVTDADQVMALHRWVGTGVGVLGLGLGIWAWVRPEADRSIGMIVALALMTAAILVQGWLGGAMIHGIDHLNW